MSKNTPLPYFELVMRPADSRPVVVLVMLDFEETGDVNISGGSYADLLELVHVWDFARNAVADELLYRWKHPLIYGDENGVYKPPTNDDIPF